MSSLKWDEIGTRVYETGLDKGVLYLPDGSGVSWSGLISVIESFSKEASSVYYDGMKISNLVTLGEFTASMSAVTYPDEFVELETLRATKAGLYYSDQPTQSFGLCYRTQIGNDLLGDVIGYKIHVLYNVTAVPSEKTYATASSDPSLVEFEWDIVAIPEEIPGFAPTSHIIIDTTKIDPYLLEDLEDLLYGDSDSDATLIPISDLVELINTWFRVKIIDNGDGTWTAISDRPEFIIFGPNDYFEIVGVNAVYLDDVTFVVTDTLDIDEVPQITINDNTNGTWTATTSHDNVIVDLGDEIVEIRNANVVYLNDTVYRISDTTYED